MERFEWIVGRLFVLAMITLVVVVLSGCTMHLPSVQVTPAQFMSSDPKNVEAAFCLAGVGAEKRVEEVTGMYFTEKPKIVFLRSEESPLFWFQRSLLRPGLILLSTTDGEEIHVFTDQFARLTMDADALIKLSFNILHHEYVHVLQFKKLGKDRGELDRSTIIKMEIMAYAVGNRLSQERYGNKAILLHPPYPFADEVDAFFEGEGLIEWVED